MRYEVLFLDLYAFLAFNEFLYTFMSIYVTEGCQHIYDIFIFFLCSQTNKFFQELIQLSQILRLVWEASKNISHKS